jgi:two-component system chemotaxis response regulator CheY
MFGANTKVLIVDDMSTMRKLVKRSVGLLGMAQHEEAADGQIAWTLLNEKKDFGLVISDWNMPNCSGLDFLKRVRADSQFKNLPFVLLTAEGEAEQVKEAIMAGVDSYILKPFTHDSLTAKLEQAYKKRITGAK